LIETTNDKILRPSTKD